MAGKRSNHKLKSHKLGHALERRGEFLGEKGRKAEACIKCCVTQYDHGFNSLLPEKGQSFDDKPGANALTLSIGTYRHRSKRNRIHVSSVDLDRQRAEQQVPNHFISIQSNQRCDDQVCGTQLIDQLRLVVTSKRSSIEGANCGKI